LNFLKNFRNNYKLNSINSSSNNVNVTTLSCREKKNPPSVKLRCRKERGFFFWTKINKTVSLVVTFTGNREYLRGVINIWKNNYNYRRWIPERVFIGNAFFSYKLHGNHQTALLNKSDILKIFRFRILFKYNESKIKPLIYYYLVKKFNWLKLFLSVLYIERANYIHL